MKAKTITLSKNTKPVELLQVRKKTRNRRSITIGLLVTFTIFVSFLTYFAIIPLLTIQSKIEEIKSEGKELINKFETKDLTAFDDHFIKIQNSIEEIDNELNKFEVISNIGFLEGYYNNIKILRVILDKSDRLLSENIPELKNILASDGFKIDTTDEIDEERNTLNMLLGGLPEYIALYEDSEPKLLEIMNDVKKLDTNYIPNLIIFNPLNSYERVRKLADDFSEISKNSTEFLRNLPALLGSGEEKTYLIILQNETELRSSGGLLTAFGTGTVRDGEVGDISLTSTWTLQDDLWAIRGLRMPRNNIYGQDYLMTFNNSCGSTEARVQDVGLYPDLKLTMQYFKEYYDIARRYFPNGYPAYDHILMLDYAFSENLLEIIQPLEIEGFGTANAENLYNFIKEETDDTSNINEDERKEIIKELANAAKEKLLNLDNDKLIELVKIIINSFQAKDIGIYSNDENLQIFLDKYNLSGQSEKEFEGDYFQFNEAQNCARKLNRFIRDTVDLNININDDNSISSSAKIKWLQTQVYEPSLEKQYDPTLQYSYRAWVRLFFPPGTTGIDSDGYSRSGYLDYFPFDYYDEEMNKETVDNIVQFDHRRFQEADAIEREEMNISWNQPAEIRYDDNYKLLLQKHPGKSWGEPYTIKFNYKGQDYSTTLTLDKDKVIQFKNGEILIEDYDKSLNWVTELIDSFSN